MGARQSGTGAERLRARSEPQVCESFLASAPGLRHQAVSPYSAPSCPNLLIYSIRAGERCSRGAKLQQLGARRRLPAAEGKPKALSLPPGLEEVQTCEMRLAMQKEIGSARDDNEPKNWWVFLTPARRCKNPLPQAAYRILFKSSGGGLREVCLQADQKVESFSYSYSVTRLMGMSRDEERVTDTYVYLRLPWRAEKCLLALQDGRLSGSVLLHFKI